MPGKLSLFSLSVSEEEKRQTRGTRSEANEREETSKPGHEDIQEVILPIQSAQIWLRRKDIMDTSSYIVLDMSQRSRPDPIIPLRQGRCSSAREGGRHASRVSREDLARLKEAMCGSAKPRC